MTLPVIEIKPPYTPEFLQVVRYAVEHILKDGGDVFEFGSGFSTLWFAQFADVVTVEHDEEWYEELLKALDDSGLEADHHLVPLPDMHAVIDDYGLFDLVLVDCWDDGRIPAVMSSMPHVKPGGWLLLDDSHWPHLAQARKVLSRWPVTMIKGPHMRHTGIQRDHQTSMYRRPL